MPNTIVYFIGGPLAGTSAEMPEPLNSVYTVAVEAPAATEFDPPTVNPHPLPAETLYILHTIRSRGGADSRCYVDSQKELGGITKEDVEHLPR